jgi:two-component system cell cycle sensor histidine kinase/response regulator CckA
MIMLNPAEEAHKTLVKAELSALKARELTKQLITFAKGGAPVKKTAQIEDLIRDSVKFSLRGSNIRCMFKIQEDLYPVDIDHDQMVQVINNMIMNAQESMPDGGSIKVTAENTFIKQGGSIPLKEGKYVKIAFQDRGIGIDDENLKQIFDPFYSTKSTGSGLGLAVVYSIIKKHDGHITAESIVGVGTTFYIYLPASDKPTTIKEEKLPHGKSRILVVDDEEMIRDVVSNMLHMSGYEVECAADGSEAIDLYIKAKREEHPFDAVIIDLTIPGGMGGEKTIKKLIEVDPRVKAVVSSGYSSDPIMSDFKHYGFLGAIDKPYRIQELERTLQNILNNDGNKNNDNNIEPHLNSLKF